MLHANYGREVINCLIPDLYQDYTKVVVAGSRIKHNGYHDKNKQRVFYEQIFEPKIIQWLKNEGLYDSSCEKIDKEWQKRNKVIFISGMAMSGADKAIVTFCEKYGLDYVPMAADWSLGRSAGHIRNKEMIDYATHGNKDGNLVVFYDGVSKGTAGIMALGESNPHIHIDIFCIHI